MEPRSEKDPQEGNEDQVPSIPRSGKVWGPGHVSKRLKASFTLRSHHSLPPFPFPETVMM